MPRPGVHSCSFQTFPPPSAPTPQVLAGEPLSQTMTEPPTAGQPQIQCFHLYDQDPHDLAIWQSPWGPTFTQI